MITLNSVQFGGRTQKMSPKSSQAVSRLKRKRDTSPDSADTSPSSSELEQEQAEDVPVLSHAARRKQKKKAAPNKTPTKKHKKEEDDSHSIKRQNSVWVGNLCYKTTPEALRRFFDGVGEITRVHLPTKLGNASPAGEPARRENRGCVSRFTDYRLGCPRFLCCSHLTNSFAYVDFATPDAKQVAIAMSESPLDGRRLLIKDGAWRRPFKHHFRFFFSPVRCSGDENFSNQKLLDLGDSFEGRPAPAKPGTSLELETGVGAARGRGGQTKFAQEVLSAQKWPPAPTLFFGNLGFETTVDSIRGLLEAHKHKEKEVNANAAAAAATTSESAAAANDDGGANGADDDGGGGGDPWIRKIRMGTFEDSGQCKGSVGAGPDKKNLLIYFGEIPLLSREMMPPDSRLSISRA